MQMTNRCKTISWHSDDQNGLQEPTTSHGISSVNQQLQQINNMSHCQIINYSSHTMCSIRALHWRHSGRISVSNHQPHDYLLNRLFRRRSKKTSKLHVTGLCAGNSPGTGEFPAQMTSNAENVSIWWRHHGLYRIVCLSHCFLGKVSILLKI